MIKVVGSQRHNSIGSFLHLVSYCFCWEKMCEHNNLDIGLRKKLKNASKPNHDFEQ